MDLLKVDYLKKITISIEAGSTVQTMNLDDGPSLFDFIFGIGLNGITELEKRLHGRSKGEEIAFHIWNHHL